MNVEEAINHLGFGAEHHSLDQWLSKLAITQRPVFEENPMEWIDQKEEGYILMFSASFGYEERWGAVTGPGTMALSGIRLHSADNTHGYPTFEGYLPPELHFDMSISGAKAKLGTPDFDDEEDDDDDERILVWYNVIISSKKMAIHMVFDRKSGKMKTISFEPVKLKHSSP